MIKYLKLASACILCIVLLQGEFVFDLRAQHSTVSKYGTTPSEEVASKIQRTILADALLNLAEMRHIELAYAPELLAGKTSNCPDLPDKDREAIECILAESGLRIKQLTNGVYVIQKPAKLSDGIRGSVMGTVHSYRDREVLSGAHVLITGTPFATASGSNGSFTIEHVPPGLYDVCASMIGYKPRCFPQVHVIEGEAIEMALEMEETTLPLDEVLILSEEERRRLALPDSLNPLDYQGIHIGSVSAGLFLSSRPNVVDGIQLGGLGSMARDSLRGVQFAGVFNSAENASRGLQFSGVFNRIGSDLEGFQVSGVVNHLTGNLDGGQLSGTINTAAHVHGGQFSGVANLANGVATGIQMAGVVNMAMEDGWGIQAAGVANRAVSYRGVQFAGVLNATGAMRGVQAGGVVNIADGNVRGAQLAGLVNVAGDISAGAQIGLVNYARSNKGLPLGLLSYVKETGLRYDVWADETGMVTAAIRSGNRWFSNYLGFSALPAEEPMNKAAVVGFGGEYSFRPRIYGALDIMHSILWQDSESFSEHITKLRILVGFKATPYLAIFAGPSLNLLFSDTPETNIDIPRRIDNGQWGSTYYSLWSGFAVGVRLSGRP